jgi:Family of unknown function (DUF6212)
MELLLDAALLGRFLDLRPKVVVASCDALAAVSLDDSTDPPFDVWVFMPDAATSAVRPQAVLPTNGGKVIAVPNPPAATCVLAAQTEQGAEALEVLRAWWLANGPSPAAPVLRCRDGDSAAVEIMGVLLRSAQQELRDLAAQVNGTTAQMYELRCEYDQIRVAVEGLQGQILRLRQRPHLLTVSLPPNGRVFAPHEGHGALVQSLPVSAEGLAGVDLHFPACGPVADDAQVLVHLHARDIGRDLGAWRLLAQHLGKGWVRCWLPEVLAVTSHNVEVRVEWLGAGGCVPAVSLASAGDWHEMLARPQGSAVALEDCLALTAWAGGVPGIPLKCGPWACAIQDDNRIEFSLCREEIERMLLHVPMAEEKPAQWYPFQVRADGSFLLHPLGSLATTLQLTNGCPPGLDRVTAVVKITQPLAQGDALYALAVARGDEANTSMDHADLASDPRFLAFSGWQRVPRDQAPHVLVLDFAEPLVQPAHLLLATRMPPGVDHGWVWAEWLDIRLRVQGVQAPELERSDYLKTKRVA